MNRKDYDSLIGSARYDIEKCNDAAAVAEHIVDTVLKKAGVDIPEQPISEQMWTDSVVIPEGYDIYCNDKNIGWARTGVMKNIILAIPALLKAGEEISLDCSGCVGGDEPDVTVPCKHVVNMRKALKEITDGSA